MEEKIMVGYELPEPKEYAEPSSIAPIGYCSECGNDIFFGEEIWEIHGDWYCESCIDGFQKEAEGEIYFDDVI